MKTVYVLISTCLLQYVRLRRLRGQIRQGVPCDGYRTGLCRVGDTVE